MVKLRRVPLAVRSGERPLPPVAPGRRPAPRAPGAPGAPGARRALRAPGDSGQRRAAGRHPAGQPPEPGGGGVAEESEP